MYIDKLFLVAVSLYASSAQGTVTVSAVSPYTQDDDANIYFATTAATLSMDEDFHQFDVSVSQDNESEGSRDDMILLDISSSDDDFDPDTTTGQELVITIFVEDSEGDSYAIPIAAAGYTDDVPDDCTSETCKAELETGRYFSAVYEEGKTLRIGIYPKDICVYTYAQSSGNAADGCDDDAPESLSSVGVGDSTTMDLSVYVGVAEEDETIDPDGSNTIDGATAVTLYFHSDSLSISSCPTGDYYTPGDSQIFVNPALFELSGEATVPPVKYFLILANLDAAIVTDSSSFDSNSISYRLNYEDTLSGIGGFSNTTNGDDNRYDMGFAAIDYSGVVSSIACELPGVQTAAINTFLSDSNCFIATAAFGGVNVPPVAMLREFRDRVLLQKTWGQAFVSTYYQWSPQAAKWLSGHPVFRFPVLIWLIPLEILAWFALHPIFFWLGAVLGLVTGSVLLFREPEHRRPS